MDFDHMLNGASSRQRHQDMIREAQQERLAHEMGKFYDDDTTKHSRKSKGWIAKIFNLGR